MIDTSEEFIETQPTVKEPKQDTISSEDTEDFIYSLGVCPDCLELYDGCICTDPQSLYAFV